VSVRSPEPASIDTETGDSRAAAAAVPAPSCLVCGSERARRLYALSRFDIHRCAVCGQVFLFPLPSEAQIAELFARLYRDGKGSVPELQGYYAACFDASPTSPVVRTSRSWLQAIARHAAGGRLLDIGCGTGIFCHTARAFGWQPLGIDEAGQAVDFARREHHLDVQRGNFESLALEPDAFDLVTMWDVIEHSRAPRRLVADAVRCLRPGGLLAVSTPNQENIMEVVAGPLYRITGGRVRKPLEKFYLLEHFLYFTAATLRRLLADAGLEILELRLESTDLGRLTLHPLVRLGLQTLFLVARPLGLENRLLAIARKRAPGNA
jgi:2-polyprenyl-3-methyl-5-hydroxy-6-metoxy-1,4-benzoquinol methylase